MTDGTSAIQTVLGMADRAFANPMDKQNNEDWGALVEALMDALTKSAARIDAAAVVLGEFADAVELSDDANAVSLLNSVDQVGDVK
ncbi:hypothetical protein FB566_0856 [Stackebrandtia endophytica]|uniref:Uncharacterized protein n=2 Tax=Stackebrandtia endophytica TaxID=1496996 RepID=A0A543AS08_9ACTN|nr:hypothetical protein FB566_0856 [Stackebrandtia endophytica]